jgi:hypothetical protein
MQGTLLSMKRSIPTAVILTLITCGIYGLFWQANQMSAVNALLKEQKYSFLKWLVLTIITCGIYYIYYEYEMGQDIYELQVKNGIVAPNANLSVMSLILSLLSLMIVVDAIQQNEINKIIDAVAT